ncbi:MAG: thiamine phosphate synthase, partial [Candidatus Dadabacteria bacterium]|nr:thiamine phosphate synthase [Candidatus Dadabacteria bacterium]
MGFELKGLYVITDEGLILRGSVCEAVEKSLVGGAKIVQLRDKNSSFREVVALGKALLGITKRYGVPLIINDSPEMMMEIKADGVHLGEHDPNIVLTRKKLGNGAIIGVSCYGSIPRGIHAERMGADYVVFGTPWSTPTKPWRIPTPFETLVDARAVIKGIPMFAIGGIFPHNAAQVLATGVDGVAVITSVFGS